MSAWRPIETAPKDGTRVLICHGHAPRNIYVAWWLDEAQFGDDKTGPGWQIFDCGMDVWYAVATDDPTHWMPLPDPPEDKP